MPTPARLDPHRSALLIIDLQERLMPVIHEGPTCVRRCARLVEGAQALSVPRLVTEQYPRGLGATVPEVARYLDPETTCIEDKTCFSACTGRVGGMIEMLGVRSVILCGVEAHVCVLHTALDLLEKGYTVAFCEDGTGSRRPIDKHAATHRMIQAGVIPTTVEAALMELAGDAASERFRAIRNIIKSGPGE